MMLKILRNGLTQCSSKRGLFCSAAKFDAAYEGPGKTTVNILNENKDKLMVDGFSRVGFTLNNEMRAMGPIALFPDAVFQWNIKDTLSVTADAFVLFELLDPKPEIVFFGYGSKVDTNIKTTSSFGKEYFDKRGKMIAKIIMTMRSRKINIEAMPTEDAIGAYNYLVEEDRLVAAALIPPEEVKLSTESKHVDDVLLQRGTEFGEKIGGTTAGLSWLDHFEIQNLKEEYKDFKEFSQDPEAYRKSLKAQKDYEKDFKK